MTSNTTTATKKSDLLVFDGRSVAEIIGYELTYDYTNTENYVYVEIVGQIQEFPRNRSHGGSTIILHIDGTRVTLEDAYLSAHHMEYEPDGYDSPITEMEIAARSIHATDDL